MKPEGRTETPWKFGEDGRISDALGRTVADCRYRAKQGEFIVTAVNSHAALQQANERMREALEQVCDICEDGDTGAPFARVVKATQKARAALAEAGGETEDAK